MHLFKSLALALSLGALAACNDGVIAYTDTSGLSVLQLEEGDLQTAKTNVDLWQGYGRRANEVFTYTLSGNGTYTVGCWDNRDRARARLQIRGFNLGGTETFSLDMRQFARALDAFPGLGTNYTDLVSDGTRTNPARQHLMCYFAGAASEPDAAVFYVQMWSIADSLPSDIAVKFNAITGDIMDVELFSRGALPQRVVATSPPQNGHAASIVAGNIHVDGSPVLFGGSSIPAQSTSAQFD